MGLVGLLFGKLPKAAASYPESQTHRGPTWVSPFSGREHKRQGGEGEHWTNAEEDERVGSSARDDVGRTAVAVVGASPGPKTPLSLRKHSPASTARSKPPGNSISPSDRVLETYDVLGLLGRGSFADVWLCQHKETKQLVACKVIDLSSTARGQAAIGIVGGNSTESSSSPGHSMRGGRQVVPVGVQAQQQQRQLSYLAQNEADVLRLVTGRVRGITDLHGSFLEEGRKMDLLLDYCRGGDLTSLIQRRGKLPEAAARYFFKQIVVAVAGLHAFGVLHRDIKPDNILFDLLPDEAVKAFQNRKGVVSGSEELGLSLVHAKLADFGVALKLAPGQRVTRECGTRYFQAPEVSRREPYGFEADIWSLGTVLYGMLSGSLPVAKNFDGPMHWFWIDIVKGKVNLQMLRSASGQAKDCLSKLLQVNPRQRLTAAEMLTHPWFSQC